MIIKVPIYVEIDSISDHNCLSLLVDRLQKDFYKHLRKKSFETLIEACFKEDDFSVSDLKILNVDEAFEILRKKK